MQWMFGERISEWMKEWACVGCRLECARLLCLGVTMWGSVHWPQEPSSVPLLSQAHDFGAQNPPSYRFPNDTGQKGELRTRWNTAPGRSPSLSHILRSESCPYIPISAAVSETVGQRWVWGAEVALTPPDGWERLRRRVGGGYDSITSVQLFSSWAPVPDTVPANCVFSLKAMCWKLCLLCWPLCTRVSRSYIN